MSYPSKLERVMAVRTLAAPAPARGRWYAMVTDPGHGRYVIESSNRSHVERRIRSAVALGHTNPSRPRARW